jgi:2-keto-4-pentenoate hydratase/2-oxohepta-3-ene-1,7-dioic acid hydratase in catechol pathway
MSAAWLDPATGSVEPLALRPRRIYALGLTYRDHLAETGEPQGDAPAVFRRDPASLADGVLRLPSTDAILRVADALEPGLGAELRRRRPDCPALLDWEVELGIALLDDVDAARLDDPAARLPIGYFVANDVTVRSVQILGEGRPNRMDFWGASKSFPGTLLVGPVLWRHPDAPADACPRVPLATYVNGVARQRSSTDQLLYTPRELLRFAARATGEPVLRAGDVVLTGTPGGIALAVRRWQRWIADRLLDRFGKLAAASRRRSRFLAAGDRVEIGAGPLGTACARVEGG